MITTNTAYWYRVPLVILYIFFFFYNQQYFVIKVEWTVLVNYMNLIDVANIWINYCIIDLIEK